MRRISILLFVLSVLAAPLYAHHGRGATYDMKKRITLKGTVTRVDWRNPHVVIWMDAKDETGKVVNWGFENAGVSQLAQEGYSAEYGARPLVRLIKRKLGFPIAQKILRREFAAGDKITAALANGEIVFSK